MMQLDSFYLIVFIVHIKQEMAIKCLALSLVPSKCSINSRYHSEVNQIVIFNIVITLKILFICKHISKLKPKLFTCSNAMVEETLTFPVNICKAVIAD